MKLTFKVHHLTLTAFLIVCTFVTRNQVMAWSAQKGIPRLAFTGDSAYICIYSIDIMNKMQFVLFEKYIVTVAR
jgi:hypothetical protein